ncbi:GNAT family N-acetyltransferase [Candidatus Bipolaricaulota bacterium]
MSRQARVYLETDRLLLRCLTADDAENLFDLDSDPEVTRYLNNGRTHTREEIARKALPHYLDHHRRYGDEYGFWAAIERATGAFLG